MKNKLIVMCPTGGYVVQCRNGGLTAVTYDEANKYSGYNGPTITSCPCN